MESTHISRHWPMRLLTAPKVAAKWLKRKVRTLRDQANWAVHGDKWAVSQVEINGAKVSIGGWAIATPSQRRRIGFTCDGGAFQTIEYPIPRPDVAEAFPRATHAYLSGFCCTTQLPEPLPPGSSVEFNCIDRETGMPLAATYYPFFHRQPSPHDPLIPETARRVRVINQTADDYFLDGGFLQYGRLEAALKQVSGHGFDECDHILDWGCGCGRLSRYFANRPAGSFTGADVDASNVAWCRANLGFGRYETLPLHPSTPLRAEAFDLVIGVSVFTHLKEPDQNEWLQELHRVTRPGAMVLLSIHGDTTLWRHPELLTPDVRRQRRRGGIVDVSNENMYDAELAEEDYYRETYHTHAYIRRKWGQFFQVKTILPGYIGQQDLVVAERFC